MELKTGTSLQGGKYRIEKVLGQGGFGITYIAVQTNLKDRKVAIKEFFLKEHCERDSSTSHVSMGTSGSKDLVLRFKNKFVKEAETISEFRNHHVITIFDIFEENGTAYYVMEHLSCGSLAERILSSGIPESEALSYIRQVCDALSYIHSKKILHLDIKPSNILFRRSDEAVLIDFGISKHYDEAGGSQTSSTPVGVSEGYAPTEQYENEGVSSFSESTDVYALGATLYCLLSGHRPPKASVVLNDGLPSLPSSVSASTRAAVEKAMAPKRKDRPQSIDEFLKILDAADEGTLLTGFNKPENTGSSSDSKGNALSRGIKWLLGLGIGLLSLIVLYFVIKGGPDIPDRREDVPSDTLAVEQPVQPEVASDPLDSQWESDYGVYVNLLEMGDQYSKNDATLTQAKSKYEQAVVYERKYKGTKYAYKFSKHASSSLKIVESRMAVAQAEAERAAAARAEQERLERERREREVTEYKNLSIFGTANSYIVSKAGNYKFWSVKGNSSISVGTVSSVEVLWESFGTSETPFVGSLVKNASYKEGYIQFSTPAAFREGNAVIAAKDASGKILWSWHIWLTDIPQGQVYYNNGGTMMDRNLGATSATTGDVGALGLLYQWGRKDPFLGSSSISSSVVAKSTITWPSPVSSSSSRGTIAYAAEHPTTFITHNSSNSDWYYTGSSTTDNTRWQSRKTIYDPCPVGWRVPDGGSNGVWSKALGSSSDFDYSYDSTKEGMNFTSRFGSASTIWYPASGYRYYDDGDLGYVGYFASYWSVAPSGYYAYLLYFYDNGDVDPSSYGNRASGRSVRCLQD